MHSIFMWAELLGNIQPGGGLLRKLPPLSPKFRESPIRWGGPHDAANWTCPPRNRSLLKGGPNGFQAGLAVEVDGMKWTMGGTATT